MSIQKLFDRLLTLDIKLWTEGDKLRFSSPQGALTSELQAEIVRRKAEVIDFLKNSVRASERFSSPFSGIQRPAQIPLSFEQQRLWFIDQLDPGNAAYNMVFAAEIEGNLEPEVLDRALVEIAQRHESLRTTFPIADGQPQQLVHESLSIVMERIDLSDRALHKEHPEVKRLMTQFASQPFNLQTGPLVRALLLKLAFDRHILLLCLHHIISDGWSMGVFFRELVLIAQGTQPQPLPLQYPDFAIWQRHHLVGPNLESQLSYWKRKLENAPTSLNLPTDLSRPAFSTNKGKKRSIALSQNLREQLLGFSQREDATFFMLLFAAFNILLFRFSSQTDILVGTPVANRNQKELEPLIGFFASTLVLRTDLSENPSFRELIRRVKEVCLEAYDHQELPFEKLVEELQIKRDLSRNPLFQVMFVLQTAPPSFPYLGGLSILPFEIDTDRAQFDLRLSLQERGDGIAGVLEYNTDLFEEGTIDLLAKFYEKILLEMVEHPGRTISEISLPDALNARVKDNRRRDEKQTLVVAASFTAEPLEDSLQFWMNRLNLRSEVHFAPFNQIFQELLSPGSEFQLNREGFNIILLRFEDWLHDAKDQDVMPLLERNFSDLSAALSQYSQTAAVPCFLLVTPESPGMAAALSEKFRTFETQLDSLTLPWVYPLSSVRLKALYPVEDFYDEHADELASLPYTNEQFAAIGTLLARTIAAWKTPPAKVIVLDCDNTLWGGVCGEDIPGNLSLEGPFKALQEFMVGQQQAGKLLCLCSKNSEADVWKVFDSRTEMVLRREHLVAWRINWSRKSENLKSLAQELNLGLDSFIFVDDNPAECAEVRSSCPQVSVLELPHDQAKIPSALNHFWAFDQFRVTSEDLKRTKLYQENAARKKLESESLTYEKFLSELRLEVEIHPLTADSLSRVSQLTFRTNQFNTTTLRRSESDVQMLNCQTVSVRDRFGDYGLVGALFYEASSDALVVDSFLLSCRALGKGVEEKMLLWLADEAKRRSLTQVEVLFVPSQKNQPAINFLKSAGRNPEPCPSPFYGEETCVFRYPVDHLETLRDVAFSRTTSLGSLDQSTGSGGQTSAGHQRFQPSIGNTKEILNEVEKTKGTGQSSGPAVYRAPQTPQESELAKIWETILGRDRIGVDDNFFDLGGNSLLAMRVISRARDAGLVFTPHDFFQFQTIALLLKNSAPTAENTVLADQDVVHGPLPPIPSLLIPYADAPPQAFWKLLENVIELPKGFSADQVKLVVLKLLEHHDALRLRLVKDGQDFRMFLEEKEEQAFVRVDLTSHSSPEQDQMVENAKKEYWVPMAFSTGPLLRIVYFDLGTQRQPRLLILLHHFAGDAFSVGILMEDFQTLCRQTAMRESLQLPLKTTSIKHWAERMASYVNSTEARTELDYWSSLPWSRLKPSPADHPEVTRSPYGYKTRALTTEETQILQTKVPSAYNVPFEDVLLATCLQTMSATTGLNPLSALILHQNRNSGFEGIDLTRSVGAFYTSYPFIVNHENFSTLSPRELLSTVKSEKENVPNGGSTWYWVSHASEAPFLNWRGNLKISKNVLFNYRGQMDSQSENSSGLFRVVQNHSEEEEIASYEIADVIPHSCTVWMENSKLFVKWTYFAELHEESTIDAILDRFLEILRSFIRESSDFALESDRPLKRPERIPLSFSQQRLWFIDQLEPGNIAYNMVTAIEISGSLSPEALQSAFQTVVQRHESLRTSFLSSDGQPYQFVHESLDSFLEITDLSDHTDLQEQALLDLARKETRKSFDLTQAPLVRARLIKLAADRNVLVLTMHHIVSDGWSMGVLFRELLHLAQGKTLPTLPLQYPDFSLWQKNWLQGKVLEDQLSFWKNHLEGAPQALELPTDYKRPSAQTFNGSRLSIKLPQQLLPELYGLARSSGASLFMVLLAGFNALLARFSNQYDLLVGTPIANRTNRELETLIGFFANTLVLRTKMKPDIHFSELIASIRETCLGAYAHQDIPFEKLVEEFQVTRDLSRNPLFQVMFILQNAPMDLPDSPDLSFKTLEIDTKTSQFDLRMSLREAPEGISGLLEYNADLFAPTTIEHLNELFRRILETWTENPEVPLSLIPLPSELRQLQKNRNVSTSWEVGDIAKAISGHLSNDRSRKQAPYSPPKTPAEITFAQIWAEIFHLERVGRDDNFFDLGGNSLLAMRVISRAKQAGLPVTPHEFFRFQTLAKILDNTSNESTSAEQGVLAGAVPLIPTLRVTYGDTSQQAFWRALDTILEIPESLTPMLLKAVAQALFHQHDSLRLRMRKKDDAFVMSLASVDEPVFIERDLATLSIEDQDAGIENERETLWSQMSVSDGPLFEIVYFHLGPDRLPRILIQLHHFTVDAFSVQILMDDFQTLCRQALGGQKLLLPAKTTSIKEWAERMDSYVKSNEAQHELDYWKSLPWSRLNPSPADYPEVTRSHHEFVWGGLDVEETTRLTSDVTERFGVQIEDLLLTACFMALARCTELNPLSILVLHQNRNPEFEGIDLSRSVGSFYTSYPFILFEEGLDLATLNAVEFLDLVRRRRATVPHGGSTWHWVSHFTEEPYVNWAENMKVGKNLLFNYLGTLATANEAQKALFRPIPKPAEEETIQEYEVAGVIPHTCSQWFENGKFVVKWGYFAKRHRRENVEQLVREYIEALKALVRAATDREGS